MNHVTRSPRTRGFVTAFGFFSVVRPRPGVTLTPRSPKAERGGILMNFVRAWRIPGAAALVVAMTPLGLTFAGPSSLILPALALLRLRHRHYIGVPILRRPAAGRKGLHLAPSASRQDDGCRSVDVARRSGVKRERVGGIQALAGSRKTSVEPLGVAPLNPQAALAVS